MAYPTADELARMGVTLARDVNLCSAELRRWFGGVHPQAVKTEREKQPAPGHFTHKRAGRRIA